MRCRYRSELSMLGATTGGAPPTRELRVVHCRRARPVAWLDWGADPRSAVRASAELARRRFANRNAKGAHCH